MLHYKLFQKAIADYQTFIKTDYKLFLDQRGIFSGYLYISA